MYAIAALVGFAALIRNTLLTKALVDAALQVLLLGTAAVGVWFLLVALDNLGKTPTWLRRRRFH